jgi:hypothetical protein
MQKTVLLSGLKTIKNKSSAANQKYKGLYSKKNDNSDLKKSGR